LSVLQSNYRAILNGAKDRVKGEKAKQIYANAFSKLSALKDTYEAVLKKARGRVTEERLNQLRSDLNIK
jgi:hypothetical protein